METTNVLAIGAVVCAACAGFLFMRAWYANSGARRGMTSALHPRGPSRFIPLLEKGCAPLKPLASWMLERRAVRAAVNDLVVVLNRRIDPQASGANDFEAVSMLSLVIALALIACSLTSIATASVVCGAACATCIVLLLFTRARTAEEKHREAVRGEVPEALRSMGVCFRSGLSLLQTLRQVAHELEGSLGVLFDTAARRLEMGATTTEALEVFDTARQVPELTFVAVALDAQHQSGGSIAAVLESAQESVESELELQRSLRVQTAQAKLSARIVTLMPFLLVAVFSLMSPGFLEPFFASIPGMALLGLALGMQLAGTLLVRRMLKANAE